MGWETIIQNYFSTRIVVFFRKVAVNSLHVAFPHDGIESTFNVSDFLEVGTGRGHFTNVHNGARSLYLIGKKIDLNDDGIERSLV